MKPGGKLEPDEDIGAVVCGFDREINYFKIQTAQLAINEMGAEFIATNLDAVTHLTDAQEWAGNGAMVGAIKGCTGQEPTLVGKPVPADDRLHGEEVRPRPVAHLHGRRPPGHGHPLRQRQRAQVVPHAVRRDDGGEAPLAGEQGDPHSRVDSIADYPGRFVGANLKKFSSRPVPARSRRGPVGGFGGRTGGVSEAVELLRFVHRLYDRRLLA